MRTIRLITALIAVLLTGSVIAQSANNVEGKVSPILTIDNDATLSKPSSPAHINKGTTLFSETFSNGFAGDNGVGPWEALDSSPLGNEIWNLLGFSHHIVYESGLLANQRVNGRFHFAVAVVDIGHFNQS